MGGQFSSPLSGTFFQYVQWQIQNYHEQGFRPLSRGPFFNHLMACYHPIDCWRVFSSPFSGTFFQWLTTASACTTWRSPGFRPLSWGLFFNDVVKRQTGRKSAVVFVPFLGDFFSIVAGTETVKLVRESFRPLSWGLFFNGFMGNIERSVSAIVFVPFLGDFFSMNTDTWQWKNSRQLFSSPFLGTFFQ